MGICHSPFPLELTQSIPECQLPPREAILNSMPKLSYPLLSIYYGASALPTINNVPTLSLVLTPTQRKGCIIIPTLQMTKLRLREFESFTQICITRCRIWSQVSLWLQSGCSFPYHSAIGDLILSLPWTRGFWERCSEPWGIRIPEPQPLPSPSLATPRARLSPLWIQGCCLLLFFRDWLHSSADSCKAVSATVI